MNECYVESRTDLNTVTRNLNPDQPLDVRGQLILHIILVGMASIVLLMSFFLSCNDGTQVRLFGFQSPIPAMCTSQIMFGIACPGCGLTRAFIAISHGEFSRAWHFNHASFFVYGFVAVQIPWHLIQMYRLRSGLALIESNLVYLTPLGLAFLLLANWLVKLYA